MNERLAPNEVNELAQLKCNSCGGEIASNARRVQCPHCAALFPFACAECGRNLRPPFSAFADERYLTLGDEPQPLCEEHYLRKCPDCQNWFGADQNPGYFRCPTCAELHEREAQLADEAEPMEIEAESFEEPARQSGGVATRPARASGLGANTLAIAFAVCAVLGLVGWLLLSRG